MIKLDIGFYPEDYPIALCIGRQTVSLPLSAKLTDEDMGDVIGAVSSNPEILLL